ncbi:MAG: UvrD-helicase domain-containing protein [Anaerolineales bacterium]
MEPSTEQVLPILSRGVDVVVSAGAGTGKTRTLVARYLGLLAEGVPLRSIVAITFTVKAAREMRNRIRVEIRRYLSDCEDTSERLFWLTLYDSLDAARISTIHSLAAEILRQHPAELGLDPRFELLEESQTAQLKSQAVQAGLNWAGEDPDAALLFPALGSWKLTRMVRQLLEKRLEVTGSLEAIPDDPWPIWKEMLIEPIRQFVEDPDVKLGLDELLNLESEGIMSRAEGAGDQLVEDLRIVNRSWREVKLALQGQDWIRVSRNLGDLGKHLKIKGKASNWTPGRPKEIIKDLQEHYRTALGKKYDLDLETDRKIAEEIIPQLIRVFRFVVQWYAESRRQLNGLDFDDLEEGVLSLFRDFPAAARYWQEQVEYLLVDEYQDTNQRQRLLINSLCGERGELFIVGDGKQSIYRFRGADVSVFRTEQERIGSAGISCQLSTSYRAHEKLLRVLNHMLAPVLGAETGIPYQVPFSPLEAGREDPPVLETGPYLELHLVAGTKSQGAGLLAAQAVAARLLELVNGDGEVSGRSGVSYGDIAVLCRASSSFPDFEAAFELAGIPYLTIAGQGFYDRPEIRDLLNGLRLFADPQDDLAAAGLLRSPAMGIGDDELYLLRRYQQSEGCSSLYQAACQYASVVEDGLANRLIPFKTQADQFIGLSGRISAGEILAQYVDQTGYIAALIYAGQFRGAQNVRKLVREALNSGIVEIADFLGAIDDLRSVAVREGEAPSVVEGSVQIMTVHQAKGLEFPIVVLGDASKKDPSVRDILLDERFGMVLPFTMKELVEDPAGVPGIEEFSSLAYEIALEAEKPKAEAESERLLYVAATRCQEMLIISGAIGKPTSSNSLSSFSGWLGKLSEPLGLDAMDLELDPEGGKIFQVDLEQNGIEAILTVYEAGAQIDSHLAYAKGPEEKKGPTDLPMIEYMAPSEKEQIEFQVNDHPISLKIYRQDNSYMPSIVVGKVVHRALEEWGFPSEGEEDFLKWVESEFQNSGFHSKDAIRDGYRKTRKILERFQESELYQRMDTAEILKHEVRFSLMENGNGVQLGSIDALFRESGQWYLVEFKTDEVRSDTDYRTILQDGDYQGQVAGYLVAAENLLGERPQPILCFLNFKGEVYLETSLW